jgi:hypothetical protein
VQYVKEIVWKGVDWIDVGCCEHGNEPVGSIRDGEFTD